MPNYVTAFSLAMKVEIAVMFVPSLTSLSFRNALSALLPDNNVCSVRVSITQLHGPQAVNSLWA